MTTRTIDITPTWAAIIRPMLEAYAHNMQLQARGELTSDGARALDGLAGEFARMADAADRWNASIRSRCPDCGHDPHLEGECSGPTIASEGGCDCA